ncbi:bifunctional RNase H/acid phosphatase [Streptomyces sp. BK239]|uniref:bifunctional RNase H/acid phosphatase n=1 Tax=Streptomyces sp. BK239 TaxID=2512155 RepID=UPI00102B2B36|nr:bifunctional RNase H/acid phosphatase [Streptomyces sp. BK239]RZU25181.1 putative phosphoglycerate mutase [Streptomyces sp. BK239]
MGAREFVVEADGGSRGNPGPAGYGSVVVDAATGETLVERAEYIGVATNNVAEYRGLLSGLRAARELDPDAVVRVRMDSKLVVEQMSGRWKIKHPDMKPLATEAARVFPPGQVTYEWIPREHNKHADRLANEAMDAGKRGERWEAGPLHPGSARADARAARAVATPAKPDVAAWAGPEAAGLDTAEVASTGAGVGATAKGSAGGLAGGSASRSAGASGAADAGRPAAAAAPAGAGGPATSAPAGTGASVEGSPPAGTDATAEATTTPAATTASTTPGTRAPSASSSTPQPSVGWGSAPDLGAPATLVLLRHGETPLTPQKRFSGSGGSDPSLSAVGREQAERVAAALARRGTIQHIVASPLARTRETADAVAARLGLEVTVEDGLRETDFGAWEGLTFGEVRERHPEDLTRWLADPEAEPTGGGESFAATATRIAATRDKLVAAYAGRTVLLVTHVTPIKTFVRLALGAPPESLFRMELSAASLSAVAYYADGNASVRLLNDTSHLRT